MRLKSLGKTGLKVSRLCLGSLTMTKTQAGLSMEESGLLIKDAYEAGINFIDTAQLYENYDQIKEGFAYVKRQDLIIASKTYAYTKALAQEALRDYMDKLDTDYADIFLLHEQESEMTIRGHMEALEELQRLKEKGYIKAIGLSTHKIQAVKAARNFAQIDVIHPMINIQGLGILDGTRDEMLEAIRDCHDQGIGVYGMKILGGGHLISTAQESITWANKLEILDSIAIGMQSKAEILANVAIINNEKIPKEVSKDLSHTNRTIAVEDYCIGCGKCLKRCQAQAISLVESKAQINEDKCILCGYCAQVCPDFYIKVY